ncbi:MAG: hypothetical protein ACJ8G7_21290 [Rhizobacter sp.]
MTEQFADRVDAVEFVAGHLRQGPMKAAAEDIAAAIVDEWALTAEGHDADSPHRATFRPARWVIRNQDLGLLDAVSGVLQGTATGAALAASTGSLTLGLLAPAIAVVTHLVKASLNARNKGVQLSEPEFFLLALVREASAGASLDALQSAWTSRFGVGSAPGLEPRLEKLARYPARAGELALIWKGPDGLWRAKDV